MDTLDPAWAAYLRLQNAISRHPKIDDYSYGLEAGLDRLIELQSDEAKSPFDIETETSRAVATGRRAANRRRHLNAQANHQTEDELRLSIDTPAETALDARQQLRRVFQVGKIECLILYAAGVGHDSATIASHLKVKPAALRQRLARLRERIAA
jgi:hypothetical protein